MLATLKRRSTFFGIFLKIKEIGIIVSLIISHSILHYGLFYTGFGYVLIVIQSFLNLITVVQLSYDRVTGFPKELLPKYTALCNTLATFDDCSYMVKNLIQGQMGAVCNTLSMWPQAEHLLKDTQRSCLCLIGKLYVTHFLGDSNIKQDKYEMALSYAEQLQNLAGAANNMFYVRIAYNLKARAYLKLGQYEVGNLFVLTLN